MSKGLPLRAVRRGNPLLMPFAVKYLFICASVLSQLYDLQNEQTFVINVTQYFVTDTPA